MLLRAAPPLFSKRYPSQLAKFAPKRSSTLLAASTKYQHATHPSDEISEDVQSFIDKKARYLLPVYARPPLILNRGSGMYIWDTQGRKYLDFSAGIAVNALGHSDEQLAKVSL